MGQPAPDISAEQTELIGIVEFAARLKVCPNTIRNWITVHTLVEGRHYIRVGRVIRLFWDRQTLASIRDARCPPPPPSRPLMKSIRTNRRRLKLEA